MELEAKERESEKAEAAARPTLREILAAQDLIAPCFVALVAEYGNAGAGN